MQIIDVLRDHPRGFAGAVEAREREVPAAGFPLLAKRNGARLVIINREATEFDEIADLVVREDIGTVLSPFIVH